MLDVLIARHLFLQTSRVAFALALFLILAALGSALLRLFRIAIEDRSERLLMQIATGFAAYQCCMRWLTELPLAGPIGILSLVALFAFVGAREWKHLLADLQATPRPRGWAAVVILLLSLPALVMALAPAVSRDALIYHLRFPEMTLRAGTWTFDPGTSSSFYPAAIGTLYLPALAVDAQGVVAQLLHFGFFLLTIGAVALVARRLGAATGAHAAILFAALPAAGIVAGWAWADTPLLFALMASCLAMLAGAPALAIVLLALAASIKYTALLAGAPLFIAAVVMLVRGRSMKSLLAGLALGFAVMSPWYVTNTLRTGNPIYPLGESSHPATRMVATWSGEAGSWTEVWSGYFLRPQTLDEDIGGALFLVIAATGLLLALTRERLRLPALIALLIWVPYLPMTAAMRLLLPAVLGTLVIAGVALERYERKILTTTLVLLFALRGGLIVAAHNAQFFNPFPAAAGIEPEDAYVRRGLGPFALYERAGRALPGNARVLALNEVRLFRFPRPVTTSRVLDPPLLRRYLRDARDPATVAQRLRADGITHLLAGTGPVERGPGLVMTPQEAQLTRALIRASRMLDREGDTALFELP